MRSIPTTLNSTAIRSLKGSAAVATLTASLLSGGLHSADTYDGATGQVTAPVVRVGDDYYRDVVMTVGSVVSIGEAAEGDAKYDTFNSATGQLTISVITDGTIFAYNVVITLGALISQAGKCESLANCLGEVEAPEVVPVASDHTIFYGVAPFVERVETSYSADYKFSDTRARDVFSYARANDNGIMISGVVMVPVYNNRLMPSQADA